MNRINIMTILIFIMYLQCKSQNGLEGTFQYKRQRPVYDEKLILYPNNSFEYSLKMDMGIYLRNTGNWLQRDSCLILDSYPQKEKMIVWESYEKTKTGIIVEVMSKDNKQPMYYHLTVIFSNKDTIVFKDQYIKTIIKERPISFWIVNTNGLKSTEYKIKSLEANTIKVFFENDRVFENEDWRIIDTHKIQPRGLDGKYYNYYLEKEPKLINPK